MNVNALKYYLLVLCMLITAQVQARNIGVTTKYYFKGGYIDTISNKFTLAKGILIKNSGSYIAGRVKDTLRVKLLTDAKTSRGNSKTYAYEVNRGFGDTETGTFVFQWQANLNLYSIIHNFKITNSKNNKTYTSEEIFGNDEKYSDVIKNYLAGKSFYTLLRESCNETTNGGGFMSYTHCVLRFTKDSVRMAYYETRKRKFNLSDTDTTESFIYSVKNSRITIPKVYYLNLFIGYHGATVYIYNADNVDHPTYNQKYFSPIINNRAEQQFY
jgi:hypothetical protein